MRIKPLLILAALRPHQWTKNSLVMLPLLASYQVHDLTKVMLSIIAAGVFCLAASAGYVLNDLMDREADRVHPLKANRPFASGALVPVIGVAMVMVLVASALSLSLWLLPQLFTLVLAIYIGSTFLYSAFLKQRLLMDVIFLAGLYTLRVAAGAFAINVPLTAWLLAFSMFFFLSLALIKRYIELTRYAVGDNGPALARRGYVLQDSRVIESIGPASGYISVLVLSLYIDGQIAQQLYHRPYLLWLICPVLLYWITRIWFLAVRQTLHDDPILFALRDTITWIAGILIGLLAMAARLAW